MLVDMSIPAARGISEIWEYAHLHPCVCGATGLEGTSFGYPDYAGGKATQYQGTCAGCGALRVFTFAGQHGRRTSIRVDENMFGGPEKSAIIDPGEWLVLAARRALADDFLSASNMTEEAAKFIPRWSSSPPSKTFVARDGKALREAKPGAFKAGALRRRIKAYRAERLVGDESSFPPLTHGDPDGLVPNSLVESLIATLERAVETGDSSALLGPDTDLEMFALTGPGEHPHTSGTFAVAQLRWIRYTKLPPGQNRSDLDDALRHFARLRSWNTPLTESIPPAVLQLLEQTDRE
jgi:hypothetical protein